MEILMKAAMPLDLLHYFDQKYAASQVKHKPAHAAFVTISRQTGCNSISIASLLIKKLQQMHQDKWQLVSKEVIELSAQELNLQPRKINHIFDPDKCGQLNEIMRSMSSKYYKSDKMIRKTIREIIRDMVTYGHVILVGRAGIAITHDLPGGLHIRLHAPLEWRVQNVCEKQNMTKTEALAHIRTTDENREKLIFDFGGKKISNIDFDASFNNSRLSDDEIAHAILELMRKKNMVG
jgi:cytidylate kinase